MIVSDKKSVRTALRKKRAELSEEYISEASGAFCEAILSLDEFKRCDTVLLFYPLGNEPDMRRIAFEARSLGKKVAFPISLTESYTLEFHEVASLDEMKLGTYGIAEPPTDAPLPTITQKTLCVVPALAVDKRGYRIGYGKGYYDRFLASFEGISIAAVFDGFLLDRLPTEDTDVPLDILITKTGVIRIR